MAAPNELIQDGRSIFRSFSLQVLCAVGIGCLLPALLYYGPEFLFSRMGSVQHSVIASVLATISGVFFARRLHIYPGVKQFGAVIPPFIATYGLAAIAILVTRLEYSIPFFGVNFALSLTIYLAIMVIATRFDQNVFYTVPGGRVKRLRNVGLHMRAMPSPILPNHRGAILVADLHADHEDAWVRLLANAALEGIPVFHFKQVREAATGKVQVEHLSENSFGSLLPNMSFMRVKRLADLLLCFIFLPLAILPLMLVALLIKLDSPGPVFFRQSRVGYRGVPFRVLKFRTMRTEKLEEDEAARRAKAMTGDDDPRITKLGRFLRKTRIDELPQMYNIIFGHMSWIGPRPEAIELSRWYREEIPFYDYRHIVRPGITGWAQVNQGHVTGLDDIDDKLQYDFYYIKNFSYWLDFLILVRTALVVFTGHGAK
ncbi:sugar transferase [Aurantiacibacter sediminis]|uniref:Sugar transferase n=1 Tax=Aurantiacibacter sediminis TaxID=2793064 RepID=A0ABS0N3W6_9SPHN|nr:sugar transferase [Aurantiacibacter sediminis]MBH5322422.1 sugar transferase [Aurantiacibacter sediminis]